MSAHIVGKSLVDELLQHLRLLLFRDGAYDGFPHDIAAAVDHIGAAPDTDVTKPAAKDTTPAKTNNTASPKTGDAMPVAGMMLVMAGSLTGYVVIRRKRR